MTTFQEERRKRLLATTTKSSRVAKELKNTQRTLRRTQTILAARDKKEKFTPKERNKLLTEINRLREIVSKHYKTIQNLEEELDNIRSG